MILTCGWTNDNALVFVSVAFRFQPVLPQNQDKTAQCGCASPNGTGKRLGIVSCEGYNITFPVKQEVPLVGCSRVHLRADVNYDVLRFSWSADGETWQPLGPQLDAHILSDEACKAGWDFTGAFVGLCCQDMGGLRLHADFDY